jgi:hypothetical protein
MIIIVHVEGSAQIKFWGSGYYPIRYNERRAFLR